MEIKQSERLQSLPPYIFSEINAIKSQALARGTKLLSLGIGDPDKPTPPQIVEWLQQAAANPKNHPYSPYDGTPEFKQAATSWMLERFGVELDPVKEVMALIGSKEGVAHFGTAFCNPGDKCLYPDPGYPVFMTSIVLSGGQPITMPMRSDNGFVPDVDETRKVFAEHRPKYAILCFPSNPTSAVCSREVLGELVGLAKEYGVILLHDCAYSEIYFGEDKPASILEVPGAKDVAIEYHSFSKSYNMTGWRIGFAVGNADLVAGLLRAKTNIDSGPLLSVQDTCVKVLKQSEELSGPIRALYKERKEVLLQGLEKIGIEYFEPKATMFVWAKVPNGLDGMELTKGLIEQQGLVVTPGIGFGQEGEGFFRMALTVETPQIEEAVHKLGKYLGA